MTTAALTDELNRFLQRESIRDRPLLVAVSGGPDSLALLDALHYLRTAPVIAAHLNHQLRGAESDADEAFVESFCRQLAIPFRSERIDVRSGATATGANLEGEARRLRYDWLTRTAQATGARWVATGHTADDQAETVLHHLLRGTGLRGLRGIAVRRPLFTGIDLVRPMLAVTREQVLAYVQEHQLAPRSDSTNAELTLTRNRLRHQLLPQLKEQWQPALVGILGRLACQATEALVWMDEHAQRLLARVEKPRAGAMIVLDVAALKNEPRVLVREMLHLIWEREAWSLDAMSFAAWERLATLIFDDSAQVAIDLPGGVHARRKGHVLQVVLKR